MLSFTYSNLSWCWILNNSCKINGIRTDCSCCCFLVVDVMLFKKPKATLFQMVSGINLVWLFFLKENMYRLSDWMKSRLFCMMSYFQNGDHDIHQAHLLFLSWSILAEVGTGYLFGIWVSHRSNLKMRNVQVFLQTNVHIGVQLCSFVSK